MLKIGVDHSQKIGIRMTPPVDDGAGRPRSFSRETSRMRLSDQRMPLTGRESHRYCRRRLRQLVEKRKGWGHVNLSDQSLDVSGFVQSGHHQGKLPYL